MVLKIRLLSDLHNEFGLYNIEQMDDDKNTILVLAGDIDLSKSMRLIEFLKKASEQFQDVVYVFGNHEYYRSNMNTAIMYVKNELKFNDIFNVHLLENESIVINGVAFVGATLWSDFNNSDPLLMFDAERFMSDYKYIRTGTEEEPYKFGLTAKDVLVKFIKSRDFIFSECKKHKDNNSKVVIVTHHSPSFQSVSETFKNDKLNGCYHTNLEEYIIEAKPDVWFHGHVHETFTYNIETTRVFTNPRGYYPNYLNSHFDPKFLIPL